MKKKLLLVGVLGTVLAFGVAGCTSPPVEVKVEPEQVEIVEDTAPVEELPEIPAGGSVVTFMGLGLEKDASGEYPKFPVEIDVTVTEVTPIAESELAQVLEVADDSTKATLGAFDMYKVFVSESYVSGDDPAYQASYTSYKPVSAAGVKLDELPVIGFDWCSSSSFSSEFVNGEANVSCLLALVPKGGEAPAGVQFSQYDSPSADAPVLIMKK